eukprot:CAMPEP_0170307124 /NCGR_PEP_ID=MMETSP0116_2-20130129/53970_1 /TAXON_ID=400756 /ORGANISM="Durinskia baltica, Strain CSIRO CS-38" /LENGTH=55 /DNA_ID=CAMNT_0010559243 /DNA_START=20 /DNA_END=183 /DNA_ORIENTATION=+
MIRRPCSSLPAVRNIQPVSVKCFRPGSSSSLVNTSQFVMDKIAEFKKIKHKTCAA